MKSSPHLASLQDSVHAPLLLFAPPASHSSPAFGCSKPSPQAGLAHRSVQPSSWSPFLPSSQTSPSSTTPFPQPSV